jgi:23S rRNA (cytosine1962-C5)-methyltransferase
VHGEADGAPGLFVDRYADVLVVHAASDAILDRWVPSLPRKFTAAYAKVHPLQASRQRPLERVLWGTGLDDTVGAAPGAPEVVATERGARYLIRPRAGLSVGLFLDMREVRSWLRSVAGDKTVLNLFAYTCSLGLSAALGGAARVVNVDVSKQYLQWGRRNYVLNDVAMDEQDFIFGDALDWLARFARRQQQFDIVIVDPPSFSTTRCGAFSVEKDYARLVEAAARCVSNGGMLLAATNHAGTTEARFDTWLRSGLDTACRQARLDRRWHEPLPDFPVMPGQRPYLKVRALVLD